MKAPKSSFLPWRRLDKLSSLSTGIWLLTALVRLNAASAYWGYGSNSDNEDADLSLYGQALERDWLYDSTSVSLKLEGCMWVSTGNSNGNNGCMENNSGDGTTYWYKMANCRRAQAVFSIYASSGSSTSCSSKYFKESVRSTLPISFPWQRSAFLATHCLIDFSPVVSCNSHSSIPKTAFPSLSTTCKHTTQITHSEITTAPTMTLMTMTAILEIITPILTTRIYPRVKRPITDTLALAATPIRRSH